MSTQEITIILRRLEILEKRLEDKLDGFDSRLRDVESKLARYAGAIGVLAFGMGVATRFVG